MPGLAVYATTKAAVAGLTRGLARELGPRGITVNNIQPGPIATDMNPEQGEFADSAKQFGHYGNTRDIASAVSYLPARSRVSSPEPNGRSTADSPSNYRLIGSSGGCIVFVVSRSAALNCITR